MELTKIPQLLAVTDELPTTLSAPEPEDPKVSIQGLPIPAGPATAAAEVKAFPMPKINAKKVCVVCDTVTRTYVGSLANVPVPPGGMATAIDTVLTPLVNPLAAVAVNASACAAFMSWPCAIAEQLQRQQQHQIACALNTYD